MILSSLFVIGFYSCYILKDLLTRKPKLYSSYDDIFNYENSKGNIQMSSESEQKREDKRLKDRETYLQSYNPYNYRVATNLQICFAYLLECYRPNGRHTD